MLLRYVSYQKTITEARRKIKKSLAYPTVLVGASIILVMVLSTFVIPNFMKLYTGVGAQGLPTVTVAVVATSEFVSGNLIWLVPTIIGGLIFIFFGDERPAVGSQLIGGYSKRRSRARRFVR